MEIVFLKKVYDRFVIAALEAGVVAAFLIPQKRPLC